MISCVWRASSREGHRMSATGPSLRIRGSRISSCSAIMIMGSENTSVLPDPVNAMPIMSRPASATGRPCIWMGVGFLMPLVSSASQMAAGNFMSRKEVMGGGMLWPSTTMRNMSRISWRLSSLICLYRSGGFHPVFMVLVYTTSCASSLTALSAAFCSTCFMMSASSSSCFCASVASGTSLRARAAATSSDSLGLFSGGSSRSRDPPRPPASSSGSSLDTAPPLSSARSFCSSSCLRLATGTYSSSSSSSASSNNCFCRSSSSSSSALR
mmetsp:Transcript_31183/g.79494  ORF Transcript_31183/g.79494 Transcript_31183/m.79494 type:complete len:269 (-) Transcript_31183:176-982(-)